jgi:tRNA A-37 threonylcarbamoyl transferase component Bud32
VNDVTERDKLISALAGARWSSVDERSVHWSLAEPEQLTLVKRGDRRAIYRVDLPYGPVYLKHRWSRGLLGRWLDRLRGSATRREFLHAQEAVRRGVPTTDCLAFGEATRPGETSDFLITNALAESVSLDQFLASQAAQLPSNARRWLVDALAELCARAHASGLEHDDLHAGNILIVWSDLTRRPDLRLIDLDRARLGRPLGWRASRRNLAMLLCGLHHVATLRDCWRFWRAYRGFRGRLAGRNENADSPSPQPSPWEGEGACGLAQRVRSKAMAREVWRAGMERVWRVLRDRDRRALRNNREFIALRTRDGVAWGVREEQTRSLAELLRTPGKLLTGPKVEALKLSFGSVVVRSLLSDGANEVVFKRIRAKSWAKRLLAPFRPSRAQIAWVRGHALLARGISTARPLFALESRWSRWWGESFVATEWIPGTENLHLFLWRIAGLPLNERRELIRTSAEALGALLGKMHFYGVAHRDLKGCNLAVAERDGALQWYVLDLEGVRLRRRVLFAERASDLARLAVSAEIHPCLSRADRLRFLRAYCRAAGDKSDAKQLWRAVALNCQRELKRFARLGKSVA